MPNMAYALGSKGASWEMHYCGRTTERLAFTKELAQFGAKVQVHVDNGSEDQKLDIDTFLTLATSVRHLYVCGSNGFMDFIVNSAENHGWSNDCVHLERFGAEMNTDGVAFTVVAR